MFSFSKTRSGSGSSWFFPLELVWTDDADLEIGLTDQRAVFGAVINSFESTHNTNNPLHGKLYAATTFPPI